MRGIFAPHKQKRSGPAAADREDAVLTTVIQLAECAAGGLIEAFRRIADDMHNH